MCCILYGNWAKKYALLWSYPTIHDRYWKYHAHRAHTSLHELQPCRSEWEMRCLVWLCMAALHYIRHLFRRPVYTPPAIGFAMSKSFIHGFTMHWQQVFLCAVPLFIMTLFYPSLIFIFCSHFVFFFLALSLSLLLSVVLLFSSRFCSIWNCFLSSGHDGSVC